MIVTLPISVRKVAPLGYWLTPVLCDAIGKQLNESSTVFTGRLGLKAPEDSLWYRFCEELDFFSVAAKRASDTDHLESLLVSARTALTDYAPTFKQQLCYSCSCGRLQLPVAIAAFVKEKTFRKEGNDYYCKACGESAEKETLTTGFFHFPSDLSLSSTEVFPKFYRAEVAGLLAQVKSQGVAAIRQRATGLSFDDLNLDAEFVWQFLPLVLSRAHPEERIRILVTNHVLRQAIIALAFVKLFNPLARVELIVSPCILHPGQQEKWNVERLRTLGYTGSLLRAMMVGSLGWNSKDAPLFDSLSSVELRRFTLLKERVLHAPRSSTVPGVREVMANLNQHNLSKGLKQIYNPESFDYQSLRGLF